MHLLVDPDGSIYGQATGLHGAPETIQRPDWVTDADVTSGRLRVVDGVVERVSAAVDHAAARAAVITARLAAIDTASARPLRAIITNTSTEADHDRLAALEAEATGLRAELATLTTTEDSPL